MTVDDWLIEAIDAFATKGATVREIQRHVDERHYEELAMDTIETSLASLLESGRISLEQGRYHPAKRTSKEDALKRLFGEG